MRMFTVANMMQDAFDAEPGEPAQPPILRAIETLRHEYEALPEDRQTGLGGLLLAINDVLSAEIPAAPQRPKRSAAQIEAEQKLRVVFDLAQKRRDPKVMLDATIALYRVMAGD